jgi:O-antigen/teichoic acid export membrane protein
MTVNAYGLVNRIKAVIKNGGIYLFFSLLSRAIPFLLLPLLTRYIDPAGYGVVSVIAVVTAIAMPIIGMCSNSVLYQRYFKLDEVGRVYLVNDSYKIILANTILVCIIAIPFSSLINSYLKISLGWFEVGIVCAAAGMVTTLTTSLFQIKKQPLNYGIFQSASSLTNVGFTLLLVVFLEMSWQGRVWGILLSSLLVSFLAFYLNWKNGDINISRMKESPQIGTIFRLGGALIPSTIAGWAIAMSDRLFLTSMTSLELVGIYAVGVMVAQITDVFLNAMGQAYLPHLFQHGHGDDARTRIRLVQGVYLVAVVSLLTALVVSLIAPLIMNLMIDSRYHSATKILGWICLSYAFFSIAATFHSLVLVVEKNVVTIYVSVLTLIVNLIGNYLLIDHFGMVGAAMGNALSAFTFMSLLILASLRYNKLPWFDKQVLMLSFGEVNSDGKR